MLTPHLPLQRPHRQQEIHGAMDHVVVLTRSIQGHYRTRLRRKALFRDLSLPAIVALLLATLSAVLVLIGLILVICSQMEEGLSHVLSVGVAMIISACLLGIAILLLPSSVCKGRKRNRTVIPAKPGRGGGGSEWV